MVCKSENTTYFSNADHQCQGQFTSIRYGRLLAELGALATILRPDWPVIPMTTPWHRQSTGVTKPSWSTAPISVHRAPANRSNSPPSGRCTATTQPASWLHRRYPTRRTRGEPLRATSHHSQVRKPNKTVTSTKPGAVPDVHTAGRRVRGFDGAMPPRLRPLTGRRPNMPLRIDSK